MTDPTPMISPSIVNSERSRLPHRISSASATNSRILFMAQAVDWREARGAQRGICAEEDADHHGKPERDGDDGHPRDVPGAAGELRDQQCARSRACKAAQ